MDDQKKEPETESILAGALRQEVTKLLEPPLTLKSLGKARRLVDAGYKALQAMAGEEGRRRIGSVVYNGTGEMEDVDLGSFGSGMLAGNGETYGASVIRELVSSLTQYLGGQQQREDPVKLVQALAAARTSGLDEVADHLRQKLGISTAVKPATVEDYLGEAEPAAVPAPVLTEGTAVETGHCPACDSPAPHLHPAVQHEGEVSPCPDAFHERMTPENSHDLSYGGF